MLRAAITFFILALIAALFGANNIAGVSIEVGKLLLYVFLILAVISGVAGMLGRRGSKGSTMPWVIALIISGIVAIPAVAHAGKTPNQFDDVKSAKRKVD